MTPEEKELLNLSVKLAEDNHKILLILKRAARWSLFWSLIKIFVVVIPLVFGYLLLEPYLGSLPSSFKQVQGLLNATGR